MKSTSFKQSKKIKFEEYKKIRETLDKKDETGFISTSELGIDYKVTDVGLFLPSGTTFLNKLFEDLIGSGFINPEDIFLDAGSGDGKVNQIAVLNGIKKSIGIEYSLDILEKSKQQTQIFEESHIIEKDRVRLICGDFTNLDTYNKESIDVRSIKTFFNYLNGWRELVSFIDKNSALNTKLILINEQFSTEDRVAECISKYDSIKLVKVVKYVYWKDKDEAEIVTPEVLKKLKKVDSTIENQHMFLNISDKGKVSVGEASNHQITTVYLYEKVNK